MRLLKRLTTIADMVIMDKPVADIGADHALLSLYMLEKSMVPHVIVTDIIDGPYERAKMAVDNSPYRDNIEVRKGDGIDIINHHEAATIIIAGMGGEVITNIISRDWTKAESFKRFILQPMSRAYIVRDALSKRGWELNEERVVFENNKFFVILSYTPAGKPYELTSLEAEIGPLLLAGIYEYKKEYLYSFLTKYEGIIRSLEESLGAKEQMLLKAYREKICRLEEFFSEFSQS